MEARIERKASAHYHHLLVWTLRRDSGRFPKAMEGKSLCGGDAHKLPADLSDKEHHWGEIPPNFVGRQIPTVDDS